MQTETSKHSHVISEKALRIDGKTFENAFVPSLIWLLGGAYADAWGHNKLASLETFFTPWHAVLYSGYMVVAGVMVGTVLINHFRGSTWIESIPQGYEYSLVGIVGFLFGGVGDMAWHIGFGVEQNVSALFSPSHVLLMMSFGLIVLGPFRARYRRQGQPSNLSEHLWLALSVSLFLVALANISQTTHPYYILWAQIRDTGIPLPHTAQSGGVWPQTLKTLDDITQLLAMLGFILQTGLTTGMLLYTLRRFKVRLGFFTFVQLAMAIPLSFMTDHWIVIPIGGLTGMFLDGSYHLLHPSVQHPARFRLFAILLGATLSGVYMLLLSLFGGIAWTIHLRVGAAFVTGMAGLLLSYLVLPPPQRENLERNEP